MIAIASRRIALGLLLCTPAPALAQRAQSLMPLRAADSTLTSRRVRELPTVVAGTVGGGLAGGVLLGTLGYAIGRAAGDQPSGSFDIVSIAAVGGVLGAVTGYVIGSGIGAQLAASSEPRPNGWPTVGISALAAVGAGVLGGAMANHAGQTAATLVSIGVPVLHAVVTSAFAIHRARAVPSRQ